MNHGTEVNDEAPFLTYDRVFIFRCKFQDKDLAKQAGFLWDPTERKWWTIKTENAMRLINYADDSAKKQFKLYEDSLKASRATDTKRNFPIPKGLTYYGYQKAGIEFCIDRDNILIGDDMGLGKTIQAIGVINTDKSIKNVLIICPASLKLNWQRELQRWLTRKLEIRVVNGKLGWSDSNIIIINYDILTKHRTDIRSRQWDLLIVDECHYLKSKKAKRSQEVYGKWLRKEERWEIEPLEALKKIFMTGTPILNRPNELWGMVHYLARKQFPSWQKFVTRYCNAYMSEFGWDTKGASNLEELQTKLRTSILIRRLKEDVLTELPPKTRQIVTVPSDNVKNIIDEEADTWNKYEQRLLELQAQVEISKASDNKSDYVAAVERLRAASNEAFTEISAARHKVALAKAPFVIDYLREIIEEQEKKVVCFAHHRDVIEAIREAFPGNSVLFYGGLTEQVKQRAVDSFQKDNSVKLFIGGIKAAGVGITLTAASTVVFAELDWTPGIMTQAEDRLHRIGQKDSVLVQHLVLDRSLDARIAQTLIEKQEVIEAALNKEVEIKYEPVLPISHKSGVKESSYDRIGVIAAQLKTKHINIIHGALRRLASVCDGALAEDQMGFNKLDTNIGHQLALLPQLSLRQAALGYMLVRKYQGQLGGLETIGLPEISYKKGR